MNTLSVFSLLGAKRAGVPVRICHNHSTAGAGEYKKNILKYLLRPFSKIYPTDLFACSEYAGKWLYGKNASFTVINNAIELEHFRFNENVRKQIRKKLGIDNQLVIGHVGRFTKTKNHSFIVDVFYELHKKNKNSILMLIGDGELIDTIRSKVCGMGIADSVLFLGNQDDCAPFYQAMDVFLFPSLYEGLGLAAIEAQGSGLPCVLSDRVPVEASILDSTINISLNVSALKWSKAILWDIHNYERKNAIDFVDNRGYNIEKEAEKLRKYYIQLIRKYNV